MGKNPFLLTLEDLQEIALTYDISHFSVSQMSEWQKYKNKYSRALMQANYICKYFSK